jgi:hypothetical protein
MNTISGQGADPALPVTAVQPFPAGFRTQDIQVKGVALYVRIGGEGSAVVLLHGYGETGDMWTPLAAELARDHTVIAPDLRGMGLTSRPVGGYDKKTQDHDIAGMLDALQIRLQVELICNLSLPPPRPMGSCYRADAAGAAIAKRLGISELKLRRFEKRLVAAQQSGPPPSEPARAVVWLIFG